MLSKQKIKNILIFTFLIVFASSASASALTGGRVIAVYINRAGIALVDTTGTRTTPPACSVSQWAFSVENAAGQAMLAQLLSAMHSNIPIELTGTGGCDIWPDRETIVQSLTYRQ